MLTSLNDIQPIELIYGFKAKLFHSRNVTIAYWQIEEGAVLPSHNHYHEQTAHILRGEFEMTLNGVTTLAKAGDIITIPRFAMHGVRALTEGEIMDVFHPVREDFRDPELSIVDFEAELHGEKFRSINEEWIRKIYYVEEVDRLVLNDPVTHIIQPGGHILIAKYGSEIAGTCALQKISDGLYELTKMGVDERYRGRRIGWQLGIKSLEKAFALKARKVILYSNTKGSGPAVNLYRKLGFLQVPLDHSEFERADIKMEYAF